MALSPSWRSASRRRKTVVSPATEGDTTVFLRREAERHDGDSAIKLYLPNFAEVKLDGAVAVVAFRFASEKDRGVAFSGWRGRFDHRHFGRGGSGCRANGFGHGPFTGSHPGNFLFPFGWCWLALDFFDRHECGKVTLAN